MNQTYHVTMDDRTVQDLRASSASEAMTKALHNYREHRVIACHVGGVLDPEHRSLFARMDFPVPKHDPLPPKEPRPEKPACTLFDDGEILAESKLALKRHEEI